uniref:Uncharacterized protein n=1 Tax=viral metagenome TaxID=1070528 RepID=A0A6C0J8X0_9ZZZZ
MEWLTLGYTHLCTVEIPNDAQTLKFNHKYRSDQVIILDTPVLVKEHKIWSDIEICKCVIQQTGMALKYVKVQTEKLCKLALQQNGWALEHVKNPN